MKYAKKMVLVDVNDVSHVSSPKKNTFIGELDNRLSQILQNNEMNDYDKSKMYLEAFQKYLFFMQREKSEEKKKWGEINKSINQLTQTVLSRPRNLIKRSDILPKRKPVKECRNIPEKTEDVIDANPKSPLTLIMPSQSSVAVVNSQKNIIEPQSAPVLQCENRDLEVESKVNERGGILDWITSTIKIEKQ
jgi:hypothetical protein